MKRSEANATGTANAHLDTIARILAEAILRRRLRVLSERDKRKKRLAVLPQQSVHVVEPRSRDGER